MTMHSLEDLYLDLVKDIYWAEKKITTVLPKMAKAAANPKLKDGFKQHLEETKGQIERLEKIFKSLGKTARGKKCEAMDGLAKEGEQIMEEAGPEVRDAALIVAAQKVEHYEIGSYGTLIEYARMLGYSDQQKLLQETLNEEKACDKKLTSLAEGGINAKTMKSAKAA